MHRIFLKLASGVIAAALASSAGASPPSAEQAQALFATHCAVCHGSDRLGVTGPALLPESLSRLRKNKAIATITNGRPATQMQGFSKTLTGDEIAALVGLIYTPLPNIPDWSPERMAASHQVFNPLETLPDKPQHKADPLNLFTVVETGDHHVTILDGDTFEPLWRFPSRFALHGGAKYSPDGRFVYLASRDGWVSKYDLFSFKPVAEIRIGINTRNIAVSADGRYVMAGNMLPHTLVVLNAEDLSINKIIPVVGDKGKTSRVSAVYTAPPRNSFIAALKDIPEIWEMSYTDNPEPVARGYVHNYQHGMEEGAF
ncbi:MAG: nitrite reductase, partial [Rhodospirillales bacterium]|nr:nitrite reductase [Rhodospirillales bacterium]